MGRYLNVEFIGCHKRNYCGFALTQTHQTAGIKQLFSSLTHIKGNLLRVCHTTGLQASRAEKSMSIFLLFISLNQCFLTAGDTAVRSFYL